MNPEIKCTAIADRRYRRCYCCGEAAHFSLEIGHTVSDGVWHGGNSHVLSLCGSCKQKVVEALNA